MVSNVSFDAPQNKLTVENSPASLERRKVLQAIAGSVVMVAAEVSGAQGAFNAPIPLDQISNFHSVNQVLTLNEVDNSEFDVRESYGLVRSVFGGTIGRTADYYGVSRKTIYQWINSDRAPSLQNRQVERATLLESAAKYVRVKLGRKAKKYAKKSVGAVSLDGILSAESIDLDDLRAWVEGIQKEVNFDQQTEASLAEKLERNGFFPPDGEDDLEPLI